MRSSNITSLNSVSTLQLEVLSPLHIGTTNEKLWIQNIDYYYDGAQVVVLDQYKMVKALSKAYTSRGDDGLKAYQNLLAGNKNWDINRFLEDCDITPTTVAKNTYAVSNQPASEIRPLIRTGYNQPIIPGSSIKGALRSIFLHYLYNEVKPIVDNIERELFGNIGNNLMKFIRPGDAVCEEVGIVNCELFNLYQSYGNWESDYKQGFLISIEAFQKGASTTFRLGIADGLASILEKEGKRISRHLTPKYLNRIVKSGDPTTFLFKIINQYTRTHLEREIEFFKKYNQAEDVEYIISNLESYKELAQGENQCVLRLAYGSGFHGITGDWRFEDHTETIRRPDGQNRTWNARTRSREPARYKSRKITGLDIDATLMGFVKLSK